MILEAIVVVLLLLILVQDLKYRAIHFALPLLIGIIGTFLFFDKQQDYIVLFYSFFFLFTTFLILFLYQSIRRKSIVNPFVSIGIGDIIYFVSVIPYFSTTNYILYFISGMLFSLLAFIFLKARSNTELVPLAGFFAIYLIILKGIFLSMDLDFFRNQLI